MARAESVMFEEFRTRFSTEELEQLFCTLIAKDRAILGHIYGVFGYEKLSAGELGLREMLSPEKRDRTADLMTARVAFLCSRQNEQKIRAKKMRIYEQIHAT